MLAFVYEVVFRVYTTYFSVFNCSVKKHLFSTFSKLFGLLISELSYTGTIVSHFIGV